MSARVDTTPSPGSGLPREIEAFSRDLLALIRGVRVYPQGHSFLTERAERLVRQVADRFADPLSLGVTPGELTLGDASVGGRQRRAAELAAFLHQRKVARLVVTKAATCAHLLTAAHLLSDPRRSGEQLGKDLGLAGITTLSLPPLQLEKIHQAFREQARDEAPGRGQEAWHWLLDGEVTPDRVAELLTTEATWDGLAEGADGGDAAQLTALLFRVGDRLGEALATLPGERRRDVQQRLAEVGKRLSPRELAALLREADTQGILTGPIGDALEQAFGGDRLLDLLAGLVVEEGLDTRRLAEVYARFASVGQTEEFLATVREKMGTGGTGEFTAEVWGAVESFLLSLQESPFMGSEYSATLEHVAAAQLQGPVQGEDLTADLEPHLDAVLVGLALNDSGAWGTRLQERLEQRIGQADPGDLLGLAEEVDRDQPALLGTRPDLGERLFHRCSRQVRALDEGQRGALLRFAQRHEAALLGPVFRALLLEEQIAVRRFLVDVVAAFSPAATPSVVSRLRSSPWYVTRNLTIAMGRRGEATTLPVLQSLLQHDHAKVRREAILALGRFGTTEAAHSLAAVAQSRRSTPEERSLAARAMETAARPVERH
jgi:hypothetical protein